MTTDTSTTADTATTEPPTQNGETTPKKNGNGHNKVDAFLIPFNQIEISKWNRSFGITPDESYIEELADDIKKNGLLHPVTLVKTSTGDGYRIVAGANRVAALRKQRGAGSGLKQAEFRIREDMDESDKRCLDVSLAENLHRRSSSVYETAVYVDRLIKEQDIDQGKLGRMLNLDRPKVNRLQKLAMVFEVLPESWKTDLSTSPDAVGESDTQISFSHWYEAAGQIKEGEVTPAIVGVLTNAYEHHWSTRQLRDALKGNAEGRSTTDVNGAAAGDEPATTPGKPKTPAGPIEALKGAVRNLRLAAEALKSERAADSDDLVRFADAVDGIVTKLETAKKAKKASEAKTKKKSAPKKGKKTAAKGSTPPSDGSGKAA